MDESSVGETRIVTVIVRFEGVQLGIIIGRHRILIVLGDVVGSMLARELARLGFHV